ncbi:hypothetical protein RIR_jg17101.t1 [Rhizophagus irregularis DAOM 181602=DAOM 197198]|nr:hypothetical protein RhiirB3_182766 [Rhizophagus irregularis]GET59900.1 hypothetical protein RIR_jg17101.t1 [Rhizophagus irregularis DAOM 181602=DAOM 197198]
MYHKKSYIQSKKFHKHTILILYISFVLLQKSPYLLKLNNHPLCLNPFSQDHITYQLSASTGGLLAMK